MKDLEDDVVKRLLLKYPEGIFFEEDRVIISNGDFNIQMNKGAYANLLNHTNSGKLPTSGMSNPEVKINCKREDLWKRVWEILDE
jgi:hypothetical protein